MKISFKNSTLGVIGFTPRQGKPIKLLYLAQNTSGVRPQAEGAAPPFRPATLRTHCAQTPPDIVFNSRYEWFNDVSNLR